MKSLDGRRLFFVRIGVRPEHTSNLERHPAALLPTHTSHQPFNTANMAEGMFYVSLTMCEATIRRLWLTVASAIQNATNGYVEGVVRGYRNALLTNQNYGNLTQCENIDGRNGEGSTIWRT